MCKQICQYLQHPVFPVTSELYTEKFHSTVERNEGKEKQLVIPLMLWQHYCAHHLLSDEWLEIVTSVRDSDCLTHWVNTITVRMVLWKQWKLAWLWQDGFLTKLPHSGKIRSVQYRKRTYITPRLLDKGIQLRNTWMEPPGFMYLAQNNLVIQGYASRHTIARKLPITIHNSFSSLPEKLQTHQPCR